MSLRPIGDRVLIEAVVTKKSNSGIIIPDNVKNTNLEGKVLAVGSGRKLPNGFVVPLDVKVGDHIVYAKFVGNEITIEGKALIILEGKDILAVI